MELREFHNALRVLLNIDADEFVGAVYAKEYAGIDTPNLLEIKSNWVRFQENPWFWFIRANDTDAKAIWAVIEERNSK